MTLESHSPHPRIPIEALDRVLTGAATEDETATVSQWARSSLPVEQMIERLRSMDGIRDRPMFERPAGPHRQGNTPNKHTVQQPHPSARRVSWISLGAVMAGIGIVLAWGHGYRSWNTDSSNSRRVLEAKVNEVREYTTRPGQRATVTFEEGSSAVLAPSTILRVQERRVELFGEALFTVAHRTDRPLVVQTAGATIQVLGTSFGVRQYPGDSSARVAVSEGKVAVKSDDSHSILIAGDLADIPQSGNIDVVRDADRVLAWFSFTQGKLSIDVQPLGSVAPLLSRWLDLDVRIDENARERRIGTVLHTESPKAALDEVALLTGTRYRQSGRVVVFSAR